MTVHINSILAYHENKHKFDRRQREVLGALVLNNNQPMTVRQLKNALQYAECNSVAPRVTELTEMDVLIEYDSIKCPYSNKTVKRVKIREPHRGQMQLQLQGGEGV